MGSYVYRPLEKDNILFISFESKRKGFYAMLADEYVLIVPFANQL